MKKAKKVTMVWRRRRIVRKPRKMERHTACVGRIEGSRIIRLDRASVSRAD